MKHLSEYRDRDQAHKLVAEIKKAVKGNWMIMEICGGQTHSLVRNGILSMLPGNITMVHGPGCPVCVTPRSVIDNAVALSLRKNVVLCSFGDMIRVPGSDKSLLDARAEGGNVKIVYSPTDAVHIAREHPDKEVVFFAVGFETTAPANALAVLQAKAMKLTNFSLLVSHVLVPPALEAILGDPFSNIHGVLAAGHVCTVMGINQYLPLAEKYKVPVAVTGFEPLDLLQGILATVDQLEKGTHEVSNEYTRVVREDGNTKAREVIEEVFETADREWRGIGTIARSGYRIRKSYQEFDAAYRFVSDTDSAESISENCCIAGDILRGIKKPVQCPHFGTSCTPLQPLGAPMVSSEGACAAYFHFNHTGGTI